MNALAQGTFSPIVYLLAAVALFAAVKALGRAREAARGRTYAAVALALAFVGGVLEFGTGPVVPLGGAVIAGLLVGALLGAGAKNDAPPAGMAWIGGFAGASAGAVAAGALLGLPLGEIERTAAGTALLLGTVSLVVGIGASFARAPSMGSTAAGTLATMLAGWAGALAGVAIGNVILLIGGGVVGTAALAFGRILGTATGRGFGALLGPGAKVGEGGYANVRSCGSEEVAMVLETAGQVVVVPGYGMAAAGAQHPVKEMAELLEKRGTKVVYAIHPSAGCVPGHMNIALDEANVPHDRVVPLDDAGALVKAADAVFVIGANDVVNAAAAADGKTPLAGLDALDLGNARSVFVVKRSLRPGAAGVKNPLFEQANTMMVFGDAKRVVQSLVAELKGGGH